MEGSTKLVRILNTHFKHIFSDFSEKLPADCEMQRTFSAFLGIINILDKGFLLFADEVSLVGTLEEADIFQIATISFIPFEVNFFEMENIFLNRKKAMLKLKI